MRHGGGYGCGCFFELQLGLAWTVRGDSRGGCCLGANYAFFVVEHGALAGRREALRRLGWMAGWSCAR